MFYGKKWIYGEHLPCGLGADDWTLQLWTEDDYSPLYTYTVYYPGLHYKVPFCKKKKVTQKNIPFTESVLLVFDLHCPALSPWRIYKGERSVFVTYTNCVWGSSKRENLQLECRACSRDIYLRFWSSAGSALYKISEKKKFCDEQNKWPSIYCSPLQS